ncbi:hypothetical protein AV530_015569 [Patagioenas fasciata monilis]|uniref:Uncharacterized protein n=1 Tax=Patagioenas fasciata monilis TaxID=372326 RepID=A0A1V4KI00_PATFA|nr:hypothetical protein AV530_015569 [Patagioenas fasciata monilis]
MDPGNALFCNSNVLDHKLLLLEDNGLLRNDPKALGRWCSEDVHRPSVAERCGERAKLYRGISVITKYKIDFTDSHFTDD